MRLEPNGYRVGVEQPKIRLAGGRCRCPPLGLHHRWQGEANGLDLFLAGLAVAVDLELSPGATTPEPSCEPSQAEKGDHRQERNSGSLTAGDARRRQAPWEDSHLPEWYESFFEVGSGRCLVTARRT